MSRPTAARLKDLCVDGGQYGLNVSAGDYAAAGVRMLRTTDLGEDGSVRQDVDPVLVADVPEERYLLREGDLLLTRSGSVGRSFRVRELEAPTTFAGFLVRFRPRPTTDVRFLAYAAASRPFQQAVQAEAVSSTIQNFNAERYAGVRVPHPPLDEQRRIADFLDTETTRLDGMVNLRTRQRAGLGERLQAATYDAIRGAHELGTRRDSGVGWLGGVPIGWPIAAVSHKFRLDLGKMLNAERAAGPHPRPYLRNVNVQWDHIDTGDVLEMDFPPSDHERYSLKAGDLLICEGGEPGRAAVWPGTDEPMYYQKALHRARPIADALSRWLYYCLRAATSLDVFAVEGNTTTIAHLTGEQLRSHRFPFPPLATQERLVLDLDAQTGSTNAAVNLMNAQIDLLAERRQALITAAVTSQFDVTTAGGGRI